MVIVVIMVIVKLLFLCIVTVGLGHSCGISATVLRVG